MFAVSLVGDKQWFHLALIIYIVSNFAKDLEMLKLYTWTGLPYAGKTTLWNELVKR